MIPIRPAWMLSMVALLSLASRVDAQGPPTLSPAAAPAQVNPGDSVLFTVAITRAPGTPTGVTFVVRADLALIGGNASTLFSDSGTDGDIVAGDGVYSWRQIVSSAAALGARQLPVVVNYDYGLAGFGSTSTSIALNIGVPPTATGAASPASVNVGESVLLTVTVAPRTPPVSGLLVEAELGEIAGSTTTALLDNGTAGDAVAGDRTFSRLVTVLPYAIEGAKTIPVLVADAAGIAYVPIALTVVAPPSQPSGEVVVESANRLAPSAIEPQEWIRINVGVRPGTGPRSTDVTVAMDLSPFGLPARSLLSDAGGSCDLVAGNGLYSACLIVPRGMPLGLVTLTGQITDAQGRVVPLSWTWTIGAGGDRDGDGLSNACEALFGLDADSAAGANGAAGDPDADGRTNAQECAAETHPRGAFTRYLAEGAANDFFRTRLALFNPSGTPAIALVRVQPEGQVERRITVPIPPRTVRHLTPGDLRILGAGPFATLVESDVDLVVDCTMTWGDGDYGGHVETAVRAPSTTWYFAEGATGWRFSLFYLLQNPGDLPADVVVHYLRGAIDPVLTRTYVVPPRSRRTIAVDDEQFPAGSGGTRWLRPTSPRASRCRTACRSSPSARCICRLTGSRSGPAMRGPEQRRRRRAGGSPRARLAPSSTNSCCWPIPVRRPLPSR